MKEISYEQAVNYLLNEEKEVFLLYEDGSEAVVIDQIELFNHLQYGDGKFGIEE